jgi:hypothetical protein
MSEVFMVKKFRFLIAIIISLLLTSTALAQGPVFPQHTDPSWQVTFWNNTSLSGGPVLQQADTRLDHEWGTGSPAAGITADHFSARWTRYIDVTPDNYRFTVVADDGIRLWIDDQLLIDQWRDQAATTYTAQTYLGEGHHLVRVEYYENYGDAVAKVSWTQAPPQPAANWRAEYFNNKSLSGPPAVARDDARIDFNWGNTSPAPGLLDVDGFSARWTQSLNLSPGNYRFTMTVDDGARLFVNGHLLIDAWKDQPVRTYTGDIYLPGGAITVQMEYYENVGAAVARLAWGPVGTEPPPPPTDAMGTVTANILNVRSGPGLNYAVIGALTRGEQVRLLGRNNAATWLRMETSAGFQGWVSAQYIRSSGPILDLPTLP